MKRSCNTSTALESCRTHAIEHALVERWALHNARKNSMSSRQSCRCSFRLLRIAARTLSPAHVRMQTLEEVLFRTAIPHVPSIKLSKDLAGCLVAPLLFITAGIEVKTICVHGIYVGLAAGRARILVADRGGPHVQIGYHPFPCGWPPPGPHLDRLDIDWAATECATGLRPPHIRSKRLAARP